jgi:hypothetical protein
MNQLFPLWLFRTAEYADFADLTQILLSIDFKSAYNLQNQRIQRLIVSKAETAANEQIVT